MRTLLPAIGALAGSSVAVGCAVPTPEPGPEATSSIATAVIVVERTAGPGDAVRGDAVVARFIRAKQGTVDDPALRIAGAAMDLPSPGTCVAPSDSAPPIQGRSVELLDVGQVTLSSQTGESPDKSVVMLPRGMPDPAGVVSGVVYSSRSSDVFVPGAPVSLRSSGGPDLDSFSVNVTAPREVADVHVVPNTLGLEVTWDPSDPDDLVYVDVLSPAPRVAARCTGADLGHLVIPQSSISGIDEGQLAVHRLRKETFKAKGIEPGEVRFDVAKIVMFRR